MGALGNLIRNAYVGLDIREAIAKLADDFDLQVVNAGSSNAEIVNSRGVFNNLMDRLDFMQADTPKGIYSTLTDLQAAYPTGTNGKFIVGENASEKHWYVWLNSQWTDGGVYQGMGIADKSIGFLKFDDLIRSLFYYRQSIVPTFSLNGGLMSDGTAGIYGSTWKLTDYISLGDWAYIIYKLACYKSGTTILAGLAFYDENHNFISSITPDNADYSKSYYGGKTISNGDYVIKGVIDIPTNCKYIRVGKRIGTDKAIYSSTVRLIYLPPNAEHLINSSNIYKDGVKPINDIFDEINNLSLNENNNNIIADKYINLSGNVVDYPVHDAWAYCDTYFAIDCVDSISMRMREGASSIAYYDIDYNFLSCEYVTDTVNHYNDINSFVNRPVGAVFFRLTWYKAYKGYLKVKFKNINLYNNKIIDIARNSGGTNSLSFLESEWKGKKCGFIGDSITYGAGTTKPYHSYLSDLLGITTYNYGVNGATISGMYSQATALYAAHPDIDCIFIFGGTNDYNANVPIGTFCTETDEMVNVNGVNATRKYKNIATNDTSTFSNGLNKLLNYVKTNFPKAQIILMTPLHRGYATFSSNNVQPPELYANALNLYIEDYVECILNAGEFWSCPVINLFKDSGLYPTNASYSDYFNNVNTDLLHPNAKGHARIAKTIIGKLNSIPCELSI